MNQNPTAVLLIGVTGRMGAELLAAAGRLGGEVRVVGGIAAPGDPLIGATLPGMEHPVYADWSDRFREAEVIVDFSSPQGAMLACDIARSRRICLLECSTGLSSEQEARVAALSDVVPLLRTRNTSLGVAVLSKLVAEAARMLPESFDIELVELHHRHKADAPSGTALQLLEHAARSRGRPLESVLAAGRAGGETKRRPGEIGAQALRGGDAAGEHTVYFLSDGERIELTHRATSRRIFADGALAAARWLARYRRSGGSPGSFTMDHVVGMV